MSNTSQNAVEATDQYAAQSSQGSQNSPQELKAKTTTETWEQAYGYEISKTKTKGKNDKGEEVEVETTTKTPTMISMDKAEEMEKKGTFEGTAITVRWDYPMNWEGLLDYANKSYTDDDGNPRELSEVLQEIVKLFVNGAKGKVMNRLKSMLTKTNDKGEITFNPEQSPLFKDEILDITSEITSGSKRVFLSEEQKTWKNLSNLPDVLRRSMFDVYLKSIGKEAGNYPEI